MAWRETFVKTINIVHGMGETISYNASWHGGNYKLLIILHGMEETIVRSNVFSRRMPVILHVYMYRNIHILHGNIDQCIAQFVLQFCDFITVNIH